MSYECRWCARVVWGVGGIRSFICSFVCLYKCAINCCLFIFYYIFVYFDFCFLHNFCRLTRMFFSQCAAGFLFYYGKKIQRQTMCVYVFDGYASVCVLCVLLCLNFWRSVGVGGGAKYSSTTCAWNRYVPCSSAVLLRFVFVVSVIALDNLFCKFSKPLKNTFLVVCCFCHTLLQSGSNCFDNINCISISRSRSRSQNKLEESFVVVLLVLYSTRSA